MIRLADGARLEAGPGGLDRLSLATPDCDAALFLQGASVAHFQPAGERPILWLSGSSRFEAGKAIRGGVPICFPWFGPRAGDPNAPAHGYARTLPWTLRSVDPDPEGLTAVLDDASTLAPGASHVLTTTIG
jgi:glucose-6-phosphate 1-epimerase